MSQPDAVGDLESLRARWAKRADIDDELKSGLVRAKQATAVIIVESFESRGCRPTGCSGYR